MKAHVADGPAVAPEFRRIARAIEFVAALPRTETGKLQRFRLRQMAAAELAKNSGYDLADVAVILGFASPSHLASTAQRVAGIRAASLTRLRTQDLLVRFRQGRSRSGE